MKNLLLSLLIMLGASASSVSAEDVSTYLVGAHVDAKTAGEKLSSAGYKVLATYDSVKDGQTIVFTDDTLIAQGAKEKRAHAAVLRLFVDNQAKIISITNPVYFGRAFMQDDYEENVFNAQLEKLNGAFPGLKGSADKLPDGDIAGYRFMFGMPYYEDPDELGDGDQAELISKAKADADKVIFELKLSNNSTLIGYKLTLAPETKDFVEKIGRANAAVLPYCISIEDGKATSLAAKYYLAVSYPQLSMGQFMEIADVPGQIENDLKKPFN